MNIAFRVDASLQMGSGHIMRCITLAQALQQQKMECHFLCRELPGNLIDLVKSKGFTVHVLKDNQNNSFKNEKHKRLYTNWLGASQEQDAIESQSILRELQPDWLIVDHYAIDVFWQKTLKPYYKRLMVIDDLADRVHHCDLLLDQNLSREPSDYSKKIPEKCKFLIGPNYALLRQEFSYYRPESLERRTKPGLNKLLITMGGVDQDNATNKILQSLKKRKSLPKDSEINVLMGPKAPWLEKVRENAERMPWQTNVFVDISNVAELMTKNDLVIGAAGSTAWERCCLGIPTIMVVLAENQKPIAQGLEEVGAAIVLKDIENSENLHEALTQLKQSTNAKKMSLKAAGVTDGLGAARVTKEILGLSK